MNPSPLPSVALYFTQGSSDKEYRLSIAQVGDLFEVRSAHGRRGSALKAGVKTKAPVGRDEAQKVYDRVLNGQLRDGYTTAESGQAYASTEKAGRVSGWVPTRLTEVLEGNLEALFHDDSYVMSEKMDGERRGVQCTDGEVLGINLSGLYVPIPAAWNWADSLGEAFEIDGEHIDDTLHVFDATFLHGDLKNAPFDERYAKLCDAVAAVGSKHLRLVPVVRTESAKRALFEEIKARHGEGVVFRRVDTPYTPGRASSVASATVIKFKFRETATCIVTEGRSGRRSVGIAMLDEDGAKVAVGNVTIPENSAVPPVGALIDVKFLYKFEEGALFQPVFSRLRTDQTLDDARLSQVKRIRKKATALDEQEESGEGVQVAISGATEESIAETLALF